MDRLVDIRESDLDELTSDRDRYRTHYRAAFMALEMLVAEIEREYGGNISLMADHPRKVFLHAKEIVELRPFAHEDAR
jgi:hypothetical protein